MDFFKDLVSEPRIKEYLEDFPEGEWKEILKRTLVYGIHSLQALENLGLASPRLDKAPVSHAEQLLQRKQVVHNEDSQLHYDNKARTDNCKENMKVASKGRGISQKSTRDKAKNCSAALRGNSKEPIKQPPFKLTGREKPETVRKLPRYLQNIDSKIKDYVQKSRKGIFIQNNQYEKKSKEDLRVEEARDDSEDKAREEEYENSSSSFSTYNAGQDIKEFYQREFSKLMPGSRKEYVKAEEARKGRLPEKNSKKERIFSSSDSEN